VVQPRAEDRPVPSPGTWDTTPGYATGEESAVLEEVNRIRWGRGLRPLRFHPVLHRAAAEHSREQQLHGYMGHGSPNPARNTLAQRMALAGYVGQVYAEVVAWGYRDVRAVVEGWMNSRDHREILLDGEITEGAFARVGDYWTGNFGTPRWAPSGTAYEPSPAPYYRAPVAAPSAPRPAAAPPARPPVAPRRAAPTGPLPQPRISPPPSAPPVVAAPPSAPPPVAVPPPVYVPPPPAYAPPPPRPVRPPLGGG
jgi:hypothetical protein